MIMSTYEEAILKFKDDLVNDRNCYSHFARLNRLFFKRLDTILKENIVSNYFDSVTCCAKTFSDVDHSQLSPNQIQHLKQFYTIITCPAQSVIRILASSPSDKNSYLIHDSLFGGLKELWDPWLAILKNHISIADDGIYSLNCVLKELFAPENNLICNDLIKIDTALYELVRAGIEFDSCSSHPHVWRAIMKFKSFQKMYFAEKKGNYLDKMLLFFLICPESPSVLAPCIDNLYFDICKFEDSALTSSKKYDKVVEYFSGQLDDRLNIAQLAVVDLFRQFWLKSASKSRIRISLAVLQRKFKSYMTENTLTLLSSVKERFFAEEQMMNPINNLLSMIS